MEQEHSDYTSSIAYLGFGILAATILFAGYLMQPIGQKVHIKPDYSLDTDTIYTEESRWYYTSDSSMKSIRITLTKQKGYAPYDVLYLEPDDYVDLKLEEGYNIIMVRTLEDGYPKTQKHSRILQIKNEVKPPSKFSLKRFFN
jgi:hypothetical protein